MAARNMEKIAQEIKVPERYQMVVPEMDRIYEMMLHGKEFEAIMLVFDYGFALGRRCEKRHKRRKGSF